MITRKHFAALIGFAFVAAWIGFNFGYALLCLGGAGLFYFAASYLEGDVDLGELQDRFGRAREDLQGSSSAPATRTSVR